MTWEIGLTIFGEISPNENLFSCWQNQICNGATLKVESPFIILGGVIDYQYYNDTMRDKYGAECFMTDSDMLCGWKQDTCPDNLYTELPSFLFGLHDKTSDQSYNVTVTPYDYLGVWNNTDYEDYHELWCVAYIGVNNDDSIVFGAPFFRAATVQLNYVNNTVGIGPSVELG